MPGKKDKKPVRSWTKEEVEKFAQVLGNHANDFDCCLNKQKFLNMDFFSL